MSEDCDRITKLYLFKDNNIHTHAHAWVVDPVLKAPTPTDPPGDTSVD